MSFVPPPLFAPERNVATASGSSSSSSGGDGNASGSQTGGEKQPIEHITTHEQYHNSGVAASALPASPIALFHTWFAEAKAANIYAPETMTIATCTAASPPRPSSRIVLLKTLEPSGFTFFTNYASRKGRELEANPWCSLTFYWAGPLHRSVRVCGRAERLSTKESQAYFDTRPLGSRIGAHASPQSQPISREDLEARVRDFEQKFGVPGAAGLDGPKETEEKHIDVPEYWGGWRIVPDEIEFWLGRENRLHDRFR